MIYQINHDNCDLTPRAWKIIKRDTEKINRFLPHLTGNLPRLELVIGWNPRRKFYSGWIGLSLPKKVLRIDIVGSAMETSLTQAFRGLIRELTKYESLHLKSDSQYPRHESLRDYGREKILQRITP